MRQLYAEYRDFENLQQFVREIPWGQNLMIIQKIKTPEARKYYLEATSKLGWSRNVLLNQIKAKEVILMGIFSTIIMDIGLYS